MNEIKLNSTCKRIAEIPWNETVYVDKILFDPNLFETHKARIDKVFANATEEVKQQQLQNILMRDTLFNKVMEKVVKCYEFDLKQEDIDKFKGMLRNSLSQNKGELSEAEFENRISQIAEKLVQKELIFNEIAETYNITVDADETMKVLNEFQNSTGNSIEDIKSDKNKLTGAVSALLEEKITAFIINKFDKNFDELQKNIQLDNEIRQKAEQDAKAQQQSSSSNNSSDSSNNNPSN